MSSEALRFAGWDGTVEEFLAVIEGGWINSLEQHHRLRMGEPTGEAQRVAWQECFGILHDQLERLYKRIPGARQWDLIFEYELPRERGRRPDVVLLASSTVIVIEFKGYREARQAHLDQVAAYARDLRHYHAASHGHPVVPMLLLTKATSRMVRREAVWEIGASDLVGAVQQCVQDVPPLPRLERSTWMTAAYEPLPTIVQAATAIFNDEPLPQIRRAASAGIDVAVDRLLEIARTAYRAVADEDGHYLVLVTGVPGAGKTLTGLQFVYGLNRNKRFGVFLSGNGPLIDVLREALGKVYVHDVHSFLRDHGGAQGRPLEEHVFVYDEAQRAWDEARSRSRRPHAVSEPQEFVGLGDRVERWAVLVGLVGEGQEIYIGEEAGVAQWNDAIAAVGTPWRVVCPAHISDVFTAQNAIVEHDERLNLTASLRTHVAEDVQRWVAHVIEGDLAGAARLAPGIIEQGFDLYVTRHLVQAKVYAQERYGGDEAKRFGLLVSSQGKMPVVPEVQKGEVGAWYSAPPEHTSSCCQLDRAASEFQCQGLELDLPLVIWGADLLWNRDTWEWLVTARRDAQLRDPARLRLNSYRVLLSRGRDGLVIVVPTERDRRLEATYDALCAAGMGELRLEGLA